MAKAFAKDQMEEMLETISSAIRARGGGSQAALAKECGLGAPDLNAFLGGSRDGGIRFLPDYALANLAEKIGMEPAKLLAWKQDLLAAEEVETLTAEQRRAGDELKRLESIPKPTGEERDSIHAKRAEVKRLEARAHGHRLVSAVARRKHEDRPGVAPVPTAKPGLLTNWREWLAPVTVFVGDRREPKPKSAGDLLAASASCGDFYHFQRLGLPSDTPIVSDKGLMIDTSSDFAEGIKKRNLLLIGSPAANLVTRDANWGACFSFNNYKEAMEHEKEIRPVLQGLLGDNVELAKYAPRGKESDEEKAGKLQAMINGFARGGIFDPLYRTSLRATSTGLSDFGVVTLARHPWSDDHVAIIAAGLHGIGTAGSLRLLAENDFQSHPLGGVFEVDSLSVVRWSRRYEKLAPVWDDKGKGYTFEEYRRAVDPFVPAKGSSHEDALRYWEPKRVVELLDLIEKNLAVP